VFCFPCLATHINTDHPNRNTCLHCKTAIVADIGAQVRTSDDSSDGQNGILNAIDHLFDVINNGPLEYVGQSSNFQVSTNMLWTLLQNRFRTLRTGYENAVPYDVRVIWRSALQKVGMLESDSLGRLIRSSLILFWSAKALCPMQQYVDIDCYHVRQTRMYATYLSYSMTHTRNEPLSSALS
jgi:hypothetical protein